MYQLYNNLAYKEESVLCFERRKQVMIPFKSSDMIIAKQDDYFDINATGKCGCKMTSVNCGDNNFMTMGTQTASQCGADHTAKDNPTYVNNSK